MNIVLPILYVLAILGLTIVLSMIDEYFNPLRHRQQTKRSALKIEEMERRYQASNKDWLSEWLIDDVDPTVSKRETNN